MALPATLRIGFEDVPLAGDEQVSARVLRIAGELRLPVVSGVWAMARPVAVIDSRGGRRRIHPVPDLTAAMVLAVTLVSAAATIRRRSRTNGRRQIPTDV